MIVLLAVAIMIMLWIVGIVVIYGSVPSDFLLMYLFQILWSVIIVIMMTTIIYISTMPQAKINNDFCNVYNVCITPVPTLEK